MVVAMEAAAGSMTSRSNVSSFNRIVLTAWCAGLAGLETWMLQVTPSNGDGTRVLAGRVVPFRCSSKNSQALRMTYDL